VKYLFIAKRRKKLNLNNARYELTAVRPDQYPLTGLPEISFVGRSNVGKSSIINALLNRRGLARKSGTPGKTREINFYNIDDIFYLVDLPGYGYASVSREKKTSWGGVVDTYLTTRKNLSAIFMLVDIRHDPSKEDIVMHDWIKHQGIKRIIVANKVDKIPRAQVKIKTQNISKILGLDAESICIPFSAETKQGRDEVWKEINTILNITI
jgi:GTP-binding protein